MTVTPEELAESRRRSGVPPRLESETPFRLFARFARQNERLARERLAREREASA